MPQLQPHIRTGVDENSKAAERHHDRRTAAQVARIVGIALSPVIADPRDARRRSATKDANLHNACNVMARPC